MMELVHKTAEEWKIIAEDAHLVVFNERRPADVNRIDFAMLSVENGIPQSYMTGREFDSETAYMQYGGSFPSAKGSIHSFISYSMFVDSLLSKYVRITTLIENTNHVMMKFAMKKGLLIVGIRYFKGQVFLEHMIEPEVLHAR